MPTSAGVFPFLWCFADCLLLSASPSFLDPSSSPKPITILVQASYIKKLPYAIDDTLPPRPFSALLRAQLQLNNFLNMPSLRQLDSQIEWANTGTAFEEYGTAYGDGVVETYILIPGSPQTFSVRVRSNGYISEGLAVLVLMDGEYQCNRNRLNLRPHKKGLPKSATEIDFRLRQKEKPVGDGSFIGREWRFDTHNLLTEVPQDAHSGHFDNLGTIEILVLRCRSTVNNDNRSTSSSGVDSDPVGKDPEADDKDSVFEEATQEQDRPPSYVAPAVTEENDVGGLSGLFDGVNDLSEQPAFGGDGPADGYWAYHPYQHNNSIDNERQQWRPQPDQNVGAPLDGFPPQPHLPREPVSEKHVHFEMGGPHDNRFRPPSTQQQRPNVPVPPAYGPVPILDPSKHGAGQFAGYPLPPYPVPFEAIPPFPVPQTAPGYGIQAGWAGQGYVPYPVYPGYAYGYGAPSGYSHYPHGYYSGQGYGQGQGSSVQGPAANQGGNKSARSGPGDPAKNAKSGSAGWGDDNNAGGNSGNAGGGDWGNNSNNIANNSFGGGGADDWVNGNTGNDITNTNRNNNGDENQDDSWGEKNNNADDQDTGNPSEQTGWGSTINVTTPQQNNSSWDNKDSGNSNQGDQTWGNNDSNNQSQNNDAMQPSGVWSKDQAAFDLEQTNQPPMPGAFPSAQPRALYGPHGPYYMLQTSSTAGAVRPKVEEEPRYDVPVQHVAETGSTHQVQPGRGYLYMHKRCTPAYIDSVEAPYARFIFKYRTKEQLAAEIGVVVDVEPSSNAEAQELAGKSKEEIIELLLRAKSALGGKIPEPPDKIKSMLDDAAGLKATVVPAPARRGGEYKIPVRPVSHNQKPAGGGMGPRLPDWVNPLARQNQQQSSATWPTTGNSGNTNIPPRPQTPEVNAGAGGGWDAQGQNQNQNQTQNWGAGGGNAGGIGDPGARPVSPQSQSGGWADKNAGAGAGAGTGTGIAAEAGGGHW